MSIAARQIETDGLWIPRSAATVRGFREWVIDGHVPSRFRVSYINKKLVNAMGKTIDFEILLYRARRYVASVLRDGWRRSAVFGRRFRITRRRDPVGLWQYRLDVEKA